MPTERQFRDIDEYAKILTERNRSTVVQEADSAGGATVDNELRQLDEQGFVVIENLLSDEQVSHFKTVISAVLGPTGRHGFEGFMTQRIYSLLQKTLDCNLLVEHPVVLAVLDRLLQPNYLLSQAVAINILPGEERQLIHHDDAFYLVPRPRSALSIAAMWAIDRFTAENGGTVVIPGSHLWDDRKPHEEDLEKAISVEMSAGSVLIYLGTLWHGGGANTSDESRLGVTTQYCEPWCRTVENSFLSVPIESVRQCSETVQTLLGYNLHGPFMGYVDDAQHPRRRLSD